MNRKDAWLFEDEDFLVEHSVHYRIAGLVFVTPKHDAQPDSFDFEERSGSTC